MLVAVLAIVLLRYIGRKTLLLIGYFAMGACLVVLALFSTNLSPFLLKVIVLLYVGFFEISAGPIM